MAISALMKAARACIVRSVATGCLLVAAVATKAAPSSPNKGGRDFYVSPRGDDASDGSAAYPWATITHAARAAVPGVTVHVAPGIYRESVVTSASGTPSRRVVYVSGEKWAAIIEPAGHGIFSWNNTGDYSDIIGFEIAGTDCIGIGLGGSFQRAISNNVHNAATGCNENPGSGAGINSYDYSAHDNDIESNYVHDAGIGDPRCGQQGHDLIHGIYQANAGGHIRGNVVSGNCGFGIHLWHGATRAAILNNTVVRNRSSGILIGSGDAPCATVGCPGGNDFTIVRNNIVAYNGIQQTKGWGIVEYAEGAGSTGPHNQFSHNLSFKNAGGDFSLANGLKCLECIRNEDPQFVSEATGDFHLQPSSPARARGVAVNAGISASANRSQRTEARTDIGALGCPGQSRGSSRP